jgi:CBS domain containing-hemolysin-like protein
VTFVLIFGEVIPQALCTRNPLEIGARFSPVVRFFMYVSSSHSLSATARSCILPAVP